MAQESKSYKQLRAEFDEILAWFDQDDVDVDEALQKYESALAASKKLEVYLQKAQNKITKLK